MHLQLAGTGLSEAGNSERGNYFLRLLSSSKNHQEIVPTGVVCVLISLVIGTVVVIIGVEVVAEISYEIS